MDHIDHLGRQYAGMEPPDPFAHIPDDLGDVNFDTSEALPSFLESPDPPSSPQHVAPPSEISERYGPPIQNSELAPAAAEPRHEATPQYVDPRLLSNDNGIADVVFQQESQDAKYFDNSGGNVYTPMGNFPAQANYPVNGIQYHYSQQTNGAYLDYGAPHGATHPSQGLPYPLQGPAYPVHTPSYNVQAIYHPVEGTPYLVPRDASPVAEAMYSLPQATLTMPPVPPVLPVSEDIQEPSQQRRVSNQISFDSSKPTKGIPARRSKIPSPIVIYHEPPLKRPAKGPNGEPLKNDRIPRVTRKNQDKPNPREWYGPLLPQPDNWGPNDKNGRPLFKYTEYGELERGRTYSTKEIRWYMYGPKKHEEQFEFPKRPKGIPEIKGKVRQGLTIWIGWVAPQSNERYPYGAQSQRCRFADCPDPNHTIRSGFPRVIFDERNNVDGDAVDVFHNAGYAHLFCFEKHFDLIQAMIYLDVRLDHRNFKREENLGKLSRHYPEIQTEVENWWRAEFPLYERYHRERDRSYEHSLSYRLICHALDHASEGRIKMREQRGGADMSKHKGDLNLQRFLKDCIHHGLVDENGDPIPNAKEELEEIWSGKRKKRAAAKRNNTAKNQISAGDDKAQQAGDYGVGPTRYLTPLSPVTYVSGAPGTPGAMSNSLTPHYGAFSVDGRTDYNETIAAAPMYQVQTPRSLPPHTPQKRKMDDVLAEDQSVDLTQEPPAKKQRQEPMTPIDTVAKQQPHAKQEQRKRKRDDVLAEDQTIDLTQEPPPKKQRQKSKTTVDSTVTRQPQPKQEQFENGEYKYIEEDILRVDQDLHQSIEVDLDDSAVFDLIDKEIPGGKSPPANEVDKTTEPQFKREEIESVKSQPSPAESLDIDLKEGDDLFGDVALETELLEAEIKEEPQD
ncbi:hypothetical protein F5Y06DRAFT_308714 [Hypoxylon sp. FL0890]|nr:hypothetical protein F5Y06DRAFT_308714 [Hypoxylon sp. FL0890]